MPKNTNIYTLTAHELLDEMRATKLEASQILDSLKTRINEKNKEINGYVRFNGTVSTIEPSVSNNKLSGIPVSIKDNICTENHNTECCSKILFGFKPPYDATVIKKLKQAGASVLNVKTNMDEFAFGSSTENSCFGPSRNPWNLNCVPGGSSGGSACVVASDCAIMAIGSDTGGSIRQPAAFCGVVGLKPTYGRVSRYGLIAFASSLDQIGPITKDVRDCAILTEVISGHDEKDSTSANLEVPNYVNSLVNDVKGLKIGIPKEYFVEGINSEVRKTIEAAIEKLKTLGAEIKPVTLPHTEYAVPVYYIIATAEASSNLARYDGDQYGFRNQKTKEAIRKLIDTYNKTRGEGFGDEAKRRISLGTFVLSHGYYDAYYLRALKVRTLIKQDFDKVFNECDCIITPTAPSAAFKIGEKSDDPLSMYLSDIYTISVNLAGIPAISLPCGFTKEGLPVGLQILAKPFAEETLFKTAYTYEQNTPWHTMKPSL